MRVLAGREAFLQNKHAASETACARQPGLYSPPPTRLPSESRGSSAELHADLCAAAALDGGESPQPKKKAASKEREKAANELLLIGRSSIRETLHSLLTRRCVLKGRTIGTNWTWGIGGVSGCRGRKKGRKKDAPSSLLPPSSPLVLPLSSSTRNVSASVFPSAGGAFLLERES